jgi:peptide/nickel transport system substrate-binding protein
LTVEALGTAIRDRRNRALHPSLEQITEVAAEGGLTLVVRLSRPTSFLLEDLEVPLRFGGSPAIGTGPYRIKHQDESEVRLERFEPYHGGTPTIPEVVVRPLPTLRAAWTSLLRGDVDMVTDVPPANIELISNGGIKLMSFPRRYQFMLVFNSRREVFQRPVIRRALNMAVDRKSIIQNALHGYGAEATGPIFPDHWAYDTSQQPFEYSPATAVDLLESAGLTLRSSPAPDRPPSRLRFTCLVPSGFLVLERLALELDRQLFDVRVDVAFEVVPAQEYEARILAGNFDAALIDIISGPSLGRPYLFWKSAHASQGVFNSFGYENPVAESLFQAVPPSLDDGSVRTITHRLQRVFMEDPPAIFLAWSERTRAIRGDIPVTVDPKTDPLLTLPKWGADKETEIPRQ